MVPVGVSGQRPLAGGSPGDTKVFAPCREVNVSRMDAWASDECE